MTNSTRVNVINGNKGETVDITTVITAGQAELTNAIVEPYNIVIEYQEPAVMPDGRKCLKIYHFDEYEIKDAQADDNDTWEEDLPWNDAHVAHVVIYD
jgi:tRNA A37 threonylcarbamoyladenosine biosynthesis protein TsaE